MKGAALQMVGLKYEFLYYMPGQKPIRNSLPLIFDVVNYSVDFIFVTHDRKHYGPTVKAAALFCRLSGWSNRHI